MPPDPLGGLQSGYARQFSAREAFTVYLGGFLVSGLGFSIPQARQVIGELDGWLKKNILDDYLYRRYAGNGDHRADTKRYEIFIMGRGLAPARGNGKLAYRIRAIEARRQVAADQSSRWMETYTETVLRRGADPDGGGYPRIRCLLDISDLADRFACLLKL